MVEAGMAVRADALGTIIGRMEGHTPGLPALALGSHIDTVKDGGKYDGNLGVLAAIAAMRALGPRIASLPFALEVIAFGDEENVRFPSKLLSSRAMAGDARESELLAVDDAGVSIHDALAAAGLDPAGFRRVRRDARDLIAYVELHIEQGPVLETEGLSLGIVDAIHGRIRTDVTVTGVAGHAGTVPMGLRRDPVAAAAEMIVAIERLAKAESDLVATVGTFHVIPGASNVIAGEARFSIDLRAPNDAQRDRVALANRQAMETIAVGRGVMVGFSPFYTAPATPMHAAVIDRLSAAVRGLGQPVRVLGSGAGHDAMAMAPVWPSGMLFLRCKGGISHNPAESITEDDADMAVRALIAAVEEFARRPMLG
jgi:allantoate deiminase